MNILRDKDNHLLIGLASIIWLYVAWKAAMMGMTHDESASYVYLNDVNIVGYLFDNKAWPNANNHYLNTLFFQICTRLFGNSEIVIRLFSVLSYAVAAYYFILLTQDIKNKYLRIAAFGFVFLNPYFLDFFSLARGYGAANAFTIAGIYYAKKYLDDGANKNILLLTIFLVLASLSLFSSVLFFPVLFGVIILNYAIRMITGGLPIGKMYPIVGYTAAAAVVAIVLLYNPLTALSKNDEFKWGAPSLIECFQSLVNHSSYGQPYMINDLFLAGFFMCILVYSLFKIFSNKPLSDNLQFIVGVGFLLMIFIMIAARIGFNSFYPVERKTTLFIPWIGLLFFTMLDQVQLNKKNIFGITLGLLFVFHFGKSLDTRFAREWWYDRDTKVFLTKVAEDLQSSGKGNKASVQSHWMFWPTLTFYSKTKHPSISIGNYDKNIDTINTYDYFLSFDTDHHLLQDKYEALHKENTGITLYKLKK